MRPYLFAVALTTPVSLAFSMVAKDSVTIKGHTFGVAIPILMTFIALVLWVPARRGRSLDLGFITLALMLTALWSATLIREVSGGQGVTFSIVVMPVFVLMLALKLPSFNEVRQAADLFFLSLAVLAVLATVLLAMGVSINVQDAPSRGPVQEIPLLSMRWSGPFETPTQAGAVGAYLLIYGVWRRSRMFVAIAALGATILFVSNSRGSLFGALAGILIAMWFVPRFASGKHANLIKIAITGIAVLVAVVFVAWSDPTMSGRTPIWAWYAQAFLSDPAFGHGSVQLSELVAADPSVSSNNAMMHAHNVFLDVAARLGIVGLLLLCAVFGVALVLTFRSGIRGLWIAPSLLGAWIAIQLTDVHTSWQYFDYDLSVFVLATLLAASFMNGSHQVPSSVTVGRGNSDY